MQIWSLINFEKKTEVTVNIPEGFITNITMSPAIKSMAFISVAKGGKRRFSTLNLNTLKTGKFNENNRYLRFDRDSDQIHMRTNNTFTDVVAWASSSSPSQMMSYNLKKENGIHLHETYDSLGFTNKSDIITSTKGYLLNLMGQQLRFYKDSSLIPVLGGDYYVQYSGKKETEIKVRDLQTHSIIHSFSVPISLDKYQKAYRDNRFMTIDKFILASNLTKAVFIVDKDSSYVYTYDLGITQKPKVGEPPLASVGEKWQYTLQINKGSTIKLEAGPEGMSLKSNKLSWPSPNKKGHYEVLLSIINEDKSEEYKDLLIRVD